MKIADKGKTVVILSIGYPKAWQCNLKDHNTQTSLSCTDNKTQSNLLRFLR